MKLALLLLVKLSNAIAFAQRPVSAIAPPGTCTIKFCPLALADDIGFPTIQMGIEYRFSQRIGWYNEFGIKYRKSYYERTDTSFISSSGYKAKTELRYYIKKKNRKSFGFYAAINAFYTRDYHNTEISYTRDSVFLADNFAVKKDVFGSNLTFGFQRNISKKMGVDVYGGLGVRFRNVAAYHKEFNQTTDEYLRGTDIHVADFRYQTDANAGFSTTLNITWGVRICYRF